jgi:hypothetical protein
MMSQDNLRELVQHPGWNEYLDLVEAQSIGLFGQIIQLDPTKPESFVKFLELKAKIDGLRDMTYLIELRLISQEEQQEVANSYFQRLIRMFKKIWRE